MQKLFATIALLSWLFPCFGQGDATDPGISVEPQSQTAPAGTSITLTVTASGTAPFNYQWWNSLGPITDATNAIYTLTSADPTNSSIYTVVVTNSFGSITSSVATVTIGLPPAISVQPASQTATAGSAVTLNVTAAGTDPLSYQWWDRNGAIQDATNAFFTLASLTPTNLDNYTVIITNVFGAITSSVATVSITDQSTATSGTLNAVIPDDDIDGYTNSINVTGAGGPLQNVTVQLNISGGYNGDLYSYLYHDGQLVQLLDRVGTGPDSVYGYGDTGFAITLSDSGTPGLHDYQTNNAQFNGDDQLIGTWQPDSDGATLDGTFTNQNPNGEWSLFIADLSPENESTLVSWTLNLTSTPQSTEVVTVSANPAYYGSSVTFTSTVSAQNPADGTPTGAVQFEADGAPLGSPVVLDDNGLATLSTSVLTAGSHVITAEYPGDGTFLGTTNSFSETINPGTLVYVATPASMTYGGTVPSLTGTVSGFVAGDTLASAATGTLLFTTTATSNSPVGSYAVTGSGLSATNYTFVQDPGNATALSANPATLTVSADSFAQPYGSTNPVLTASLSGFVNGDTTSTVTGSPDLATTVTTNTPVGVYPITVTDNGTLSAANYSFNDVGGTLTVTQAVLTVTADDTNRVYGATNPVFAATITGLVNGESATDTNVLTGAASLSTTADASSPVGSYDIVAAPGSLAATNYSFVFSNGTLSVLTAQLAALVGVSDKTYDGSTNATISSLSLSGVANGDDVSLTAGSAAFGDKNVGSAKPVIVTGLSLTGTQATNYALVADTVTTNASINAASLTVSAAGVDKTYDATTAATVTLSDNRIAGDSLTDSYTAASFSDPNAGMGKTVNVNEISISGTDAGNYQLTATTASTTANINPLALTVTAVADTKPYDTTTSSAGVPTFSPALAGSDTPAFTQTFDTPNAGIGKTLTPAGVVQDGNGGNNYLYTYITTNAGEIDPVTLDYVATPASMTYGGMVSSLSGTVTGFVAGDTLASATTGTLMFTTTATSNSPVGSYPITGSGLSAANYTFAQDPGNATALSVNPATLTVAADSTTKVYGAALNFAGTEFTAGALSPGDSISSVTLTSSGAPSPAVEGNYDIVPSDAVGTGLTNYNIDYVNGTLTVQAIAPTVISLTPISQTNNATAAASFAVTVTGQASFTNYQWVKITPTATNTLTDGSNITGSTSNVLTISNLLAADQATYVVSVSNPAGTVTTNASLVVNDPVILGQPLNATQAIGGSVAFGVNAVGTQPLYYQWFQNNSMLPGQISSNLVLNGITDGASGFYEVVVSNAVGSITSSVATVTIGLPPLISIQPMGQAVAAGQTVVLGVTASSTGPLSYQWQFNGTNLPNDLITTLAGNGIPAYNGDGIIATNASLNLPFGLAVDALGDLYIADTGNQRVRKVDTNNLISTVAGNGVWGYSGDNGAATNASFLFPLDVAIGASGQLLVADQDNHCIRQVDINGIISTVVGNGLKGNSGDGGPATNASLSFPHGLAIDSTGNLYIADSGSNYIRKVDTTGTITTLAGNGLQGYSGDGGGATHASLNEPTGVAVDASGNLFIADSGNNCIRKVDTTGTITTVAGNSLQGYSGDGGAATNASLNDPSGVAVDTLGNVFIADTHNSLVRLVDSSGIISTIAGDYVFNQYNYVGAFSGDGGAATNASLFYPYRVVLDKSGDLFIADLDNNRIRQVFLTTEPAITIHNLNPNNAGDYTVIVSDAFGSITSSVATVSISLPPVIVVQPMSQTAPAGTAVTLSVTAAGQTPLNYQWWNSNGTILDATNAIYTLASADPTNSDEYTVIISNTYGSITSSVATVTVGLPPSILIQPASQISAAGSTVTLNVTATGTDPLTYQWWNSNGAIPDATNAIYTLAPADPTNSDYYSVTVNNNFGSITSSMATVNIGLPPAIVVQPTVQVAAGAADTLRVTAAGAAPLTYQWWNSTGPIQDATNAIYSLDPTETNDLDNYTVTVSNAFGSITSSVATISIDLPPTIAVQPMNQTAPAGAAVTMSVTASGSDPLNYQWWNSSEAILDATNAVYTINPAETNDSDNYTVTIGNAFGSVTSSVATVSIGLPPTITAQPMNQTALAGTAVNLNVTASGSEPLYYQWWNSSGVIPNATNSDYDLAPATTGESDNYTVTVKNLFGSITSSVASVSIGVPPAILIQPVSQTAAAGGAVTLTVTAAGSGPLNYQWWNSNGAIPDASNAIYTLASADPTNSDNYAVTISNTFGSITSSVATVTIGLPPSILVQPMNQTEPAGSTVTLSVTASGTDPLYYQWWNSNGTILDATNAIYTLASATTAESDNYTVIVNNGFGSITSSVAAVNIGLPPTIVVQPTSQAAAAGGAVTLSVTAAGSVPLNYQWWQTTEAVPDATNAVYNLNPATAEESGNYSVIITNAFGVITSSVAMVSIADQSTTSSGTLNVVIPDDDFDGYTNSINVTGAGGPLQNVTVQLNISGGYNGDLYSYLYHDGQLVQLLDRVGTGPDSVYGYGDTGFAITLSDSGTPGLHDYQTNNAQFNGDDQLIGTWQPDSDGATLDGTFTNQNPNGEWSLFIADLSPENESTLVSWTLNLTSTPQATEVVTVSTNPAYYGSSVTFTSTVSAQNPADGTPTGAVQFEADGAPLGSPVVLDDNGLATLSTSVLTAGSHVITAEYPGDGTFLGSTNSYSEMINPLNIMVTADTQTKVYGTTDPSLTYTFTPALVAGDGFIGSLSRTPGETVGSYAIGQGSLSLNANYTLSIAGTNLNITPGPLSITANSISKVYGTTVTFAGTEFSTSGLLNSDSVTSAMLTSAGATDTAQVAGSPYPILASAANGTGLGNYTISYNYGTLSVIPATLGVLANDATKVFGATNPMFTATISGFVNGESLTNSDVVGAPSLTTTADTNSPAGTYAITAALGSLASTNYSFSFTNGTLTVIDPPLVESLTPLSQTNAATTTASFTVNVTGTPPFTYQWTKLTATATNPLTDGGNISGSTNSTLTISNVLAGDQAIYAVSVSNLVGQVTSNASLVVIDPFLFSQPLNATQTLGGNVSLSVTAAGTAPLTYQWFQNNAILPGQTGSNLLLNAISGSDAGDYQVVVSNAAGASTSSVATVTIELPPSISIQPTAQLVVVGSNATFSVAATGNDLHYLWYGYGGNDSNLMDGATNASLTVKTGGEGSQVYNIAVLVTNLAGKVVSSNASLTVLTVLTGPINPYAPGTLGYDLFQSTFTLASSTNRTASYYPSNLGSNSAVWTWPVNLSCVGQASDYYHAVLIASNELLTCQHDEGEAGQTVTFYDTNGIAWVGIVTNVIHVIGDLDISQLSNSAPASIAIPYVLPQDYAQYIAGNSLLGMPAFWIHRNTGTIDYAPVSWVGNADLEGGQTATWMQITHNGYGAYGNGTSANSGDSGDPGFMSLSNKPILLFALDLSDDSGGTFVSGQLNWYWLEALGLTNEFNILDLSGYPIQSAATPTPDYNYIVPPTNLVASAGTIVSFDTSVSVFGTSPFAYQWQWNGTNLAGATNAALAFRAEAASIGNYSVIVSNDLGSVTVGATLTVTNNPLSQMFTPVILAPVATKGQFQFGFNTISNNIYSVQYENSLTSGNWVVLTNFTGSGLYWQTPPLPFVTQRFYRFVTSPP